MLEPPMTRTLVFPEIFAIPEESDGNTIQQLLCPAYSSKATVQPYIKGRLRGYLIHPEGAYSDEILAITNAAQAPSGLSKALRLGSDQIMEKIPPDVPLPCGAWIKHPELSSIPA